MAEGRQSGTPLLIDEDGTEHNTAKKKADSIGKYVPKKCSLGSIDLQLPDLPDFKAITYPNLSNVRF